MKIVAISVILLSLTGPIAGAQEQGTAEQEVRAVVQKLFDSMRARDTAAIRSIVDSGVRLIGTGNRDGKAITDFTPISEFIGVIATAAPGQLLDERISNTEVKVSDNLASVWTDYKFYVGERFSHCGVDAFHLAKMAEGWKIIALSDTRRPAAQCQ